MRLFVSLATLVAVLLVGGLAAAREAATRCEQDSGGSSPCGVALHLDCVER